MCKCNPSVRSIYCPNCQPITDKLRTMTNNELLDFLHYNFDYVQPKESFAILIARLHVTEQKMIQVSKILHEVIDKLVKEI